MIQIETIRKAAARLNAEGIRYALVGTAALVLHGCKGIDAHDLDFLCERGPTPTPEEEAAACEFDDGDGGHPLTGDTASSGLRTEVDGVKVDYIDASESRKRKDLPPRVEFLNPTRVVQGVWIAEIADVIGLKRSADREKDRIFLAGWDAASSLHR